MGTIALYYGNYADTATLSGGSWAAGLPLTNLQNRMLRRVARSTNATTAATQFRVDLGQSRIQRAICIGPHNATAGLTYRISAYFDAGYSTAVYDSGWLGATVVPSLSLAWEDPGFWYGISSAGGDDEVGTWLVHMLSPPVTARYWQIEFNDTSNPDGYLEFGRLFMAGWWEPSLNYEPGSNSFAFESRTVTQESIGGTEYHWRRQAPRVFSCNWPYLPGSEVFGDVYKMLRTLGVDGEVFVIPDPDSAHLQRRSFLGRIRSHDPITQPIVTDYASVGLEIKEIL